MKKIITFLLTFALVFSVLGTTVLAADETTAYVVWEGKTYNHQKTADGVYSARIPININAIAKETAPAPFRFIVAEAYLYLDHYPKLNTVQAGVIIKAHLL